MFELCSALRNVRSAVVNIKPKRVISKLQQAIIYNYYSCH